MTFEDAVWIGLGLKMVDSEVKVPDKRWCFECNSTWVPQTRQDEGSCPYCYSSNVYLAAKRKE